MKDKTYIVLVTGEDGVTIRQMNHAELMEALNEHYWGDEVNFGNKIPKETDPSYWGSTVTIIEGRVVTPKAKTVVTEYEVD